MSGVVVLRMRDFFKDAEDCSRLLKGTLMMRCDRVRTTKQTPCAKHRVLEHRHCLPDIIEHGVVAPVVYERHCVIPPQPDRGLMILTVYASRQG